MKGNNEGKGEREVGSMAVRVKKQCAGERGKDCGAGVIKMRGWHQGDQDRKRRFGEECRSGVTL